MCSYPSLPISLSLTFFLSLHPSPSLSLSLTLCVSLSPFLSLSPPPPFSFSLSFSLSLTRNLCLSIFPYPCPCPFLSLPLFLSLSCPCPCPCPLNFQHFPSSLYLLSVSPSAVANGCDFSLRLPYIPFILFAPSVSIVRIHLHFYVVWSSFSFLHIALLEQLCGESVSCSRYFRK